MMDQPDVAWFSNPCAGNPQSQNDAAANESPSAPLPSSPAHREILRMASAVMHGVGHILLGASNYIRRLLDGGENWHKHARITRYED